ncbi:hypothetical protein T11_11554 [Trichinella zimbabwensis]|uniref:Uncharacterized protein n=1 Tax=Trichinella zimbabwensis TaxID=268475 RepID=A0A0V1HHD4_9BILA|nr:hypothetical protein T11_11554 [Trichinella zimbabwensis]
MTIDDCAYSTNEYCKAKIFGFINLKSIENKYIHVIFWLLITVRFQWRHVSLSTLTSRQAVHHFASIDQYLIFSDFFCLPKVASQNCVHQLNNGFNFHVTQFNVVQANPPFPHYY